MPTIPTTFNLKPINPTIGYESQFRSTSTDGLYWTAPPAASTNISLTSAAKTATGFAISAVASVAGIPQIAQIGDSLLGLSTQTLTQTYSTLDYNQLKTIPGVKYADFRARRTLKNSQLNSGGALKIRLDGAGAAIRGSAKGAIYAAASANPLGGAYAIFNLDGLGETGYGWGSHDDPNAFRADFSARSHIATKWDSSQGIWVSTKNALEIVTAFRGDRVNVIDFGKRSLSTAYKWRPTKTNNDDTLAKQLNITQDFIKFFFTAPSLHNGKWANPTDPDDIIVFRAIITSLSDTFSPTWNPVSMIGRADPNYHYTGYSRDLNLDFTVYATDRDELKPIWRKLNALAGYTAPQYNATDITLGAPWMRVTIGDVFHQQPMILSSLSYTLHDGDTTWEINIEDDPTMMQVPHKVTVSCAFNVIGDFIPQRNGRFYSLNDTKNYDKAGLPMKGNSNWLSDFEGNSDEQPQERPFFRKGITNEDQPGGTKETVTKETP